MRPRSVSHSPLREAARWQPGLINLLDAVHFAKDSARPPWQFAIATESLYARGFTDNDLRWFFLKGYIEIAVEIGKPSFILPRRFRAVGFRSGRGRHCVILTDAGLALAERLCRSASSMATAAILPPNRKSPRSKNPRWDPAARTLWLGSKLIKHLTVPAANQELILAAFEEQHWPSCIDNPLPPANGIDAKRQLHDTINRLNHSHKRPLIRFTGNGKGLGICWRRAGGPGLRITTVGSSRSH
jgi:hypothetical protein